MEHASTVTRRRVVGVFVRFRAMGGVSSLEKKIFDSIQFSTYFEGLVFEDADFTLKVAKTGKLYLNTAARPLSVTVDNQYQYGRMVVRNGYVWRTKNPIPI
jgi:hypothetical protein